MSEILQCANQIEAEAERDQTRSGMADRQALRQIASTSSLQGSREPCSGSSRLIDTGPAATPVDARIWERRSMLQRLSPARFFLLIAIGFALSIAAVLALAIAAMAGHPVPV
jgi:hypothetical protein